MDLHLKAGCQRRKGKMAKSRPGLVAKRDKMKK